MSSIFISHSSKDAVAGRELADRLAGQNHTSVFLDFDPEQGIVAGQSWERTLYRKLRACRAVVAICTDHYLTSQWCFAEIALARMEGKHVIGLLVDPLSPDAKLPAILTDTQLIDLRAEGESGYRRLWKGLKEEDILGVSGAWDPRQSPYLGLDAFQEEHAALFHGREGETRAGLELLGRGAPGLVMVVGASGSGKSSMVRAGMLPRLRQDAARWLVVDPFRPGGDPFAELASALESAFRRHAGRHPIASEGWSAIRERLISGAARLGGGTRASPADLPDDRSESELGDDRLRRLIEQLEELRERPPEQAGTRLRDFLHWSLEDLRRIGQGLTPRPSARAEGEGAETPLVDFARLLVREAPDRSRARVLLIVDQFEELLGHDDPDHPANRFLRLLRASLESSRSPIMTLGTMRSDFLGAFQRNGELRGIDFETLSIGAMRVDGMRRVIEEPARLGAIELEPGLADRLLEDTETPDALPLLSFTLWQLWKVGAADGVLEVDEYEELGGLEGAVTAEADSVLAMAKREGLEDALRRALLRMARITEDGGYARNPVPWNDGELRPVHHILERFVERRLLRIWVEGSERIVEVAHEVLFRSWGPLAGWLDEHRSELMLMAQIQREAEAWERSGRDPEILWRGGRLQHATELSGRTALPTLQVEFVREAVRKERRRARQRRALTATAITVLTALTSYSFVQRLAAEAERTRALDLARVTVAREQLDDDPTQSALVLLEVQEPEETPLWADMAREAINRGLHASWTGNVALSGAAISPDGSLVALGDARGQVTLANADGTGAPRVLDAHSDAVPALAFSPDGARLLSGSRDAAARLWDVRTGRALAELPGDGAEVQVVSFSPDGRRLLVASRGVRVWSGDGMGDPVAFRDHGPALVWTAAFSPSGDRVVSAAEDGSVRVWGTDGTAETLDLRGHTDRVTAARFSPDGHRIATSSYDGTVRIWSADGSVDPLLLAADSATVSDLDFSSDGRRVAAASADGRAQIWFMDGPGRPVELEHGGALTTVTFSPDGEHVLTASSDGTARLWRSDGSGQGIALRAHDEAVVAALFSADGRRVLTAGRDGTAAIWHGRGRSDPRALGRAPGRLEAAAIHPDGAQVATVSQGRIRLWSLAEGSARALDFEGELDDPALWARFSHGGRFLVTMDEGGILQVREAGAGGELLDGPWSERPLGTVAIDDEAGRVLFAAAGDTIRLASLTGTDQRSGSVLGVHRNVAGAAFAPESDRALTSSRDGSVKVWDLAAGRELRMLGDTTGAPQVPAAAFSPDGTLVLTSERFDSTALVWSAGSGDTVAVLAGHSGRVTRAAFSPDGQRIVTASSDGTALVRSARGDGTSVPLVADGSPLLAAAFASDGRSVLTVDADGTMLLWATTSHEALRQALRRATNRCLSVAFRTTYLGQTEEVARDAFARCEDEQGRSATR